jgi:cytochrome c oxidase assembly protein subunit 15
VSRFARYAWGVLGYNILVVLWGAYVRASGSGAGCGEHWPTCNGEILPRATSIETMIEFTHRLTSGLALLLTIGLVVAAVRAYPSGNRVRTAAWTTLAFMIAEALLGAGLVIFGLVANDESVARALVICAHLLNTLALLGFMALTAWWADRPGRLNLNQPEARWFSISISGVFLIGVTGAIAALGDTLFPAASLAEGLAADMAPGAHFLLKLRGFHPVLAVLVGTGLLYLGKHLRSRENLSQPATILMTLVCIQIIVGFTNLALLAPIYLQLIHLFLADAVWIVLLILGATTLELKHAE